jgi:hypothetical protein
MLALRGLGAQLSAQSRGTLQVATQVLEVGPSQLALAQGLALAGALPGPAEASLAIIQVSRTVPGDAEPTRVALPARTVVTLSFLRN